MALDLLNERGVALDKQSFDWRDLVRRPYSKLDDDAFTRVRVILMNGLETGALRFQHAMARMCPDPALKEALAFVRRIEHHQQTLVNWLNPPDQSPIETTLGYEQAAIEITASIAMHEPDPYMAQAHRFGMLEDFDHLYRYSALYDRLEGKDANVLTQSYTDIAPGRPTAIEHRHPSDDLARPYDRRTAKFLSKLDAYTLTDAEHQTHDYYMNIGPMFADPIARQLYAEIASIEEQHVTQYESLVDANETWLEKWLLHEAMEIYNYFSCAQYETNGRIKQVWQRFLDYELGQFQFVRGLFERIEKRDAAEVIEASLPEPIAFTEHRAFVRQVLAQELDLRKDGTEYVDRSALPADHRSHQYRNTLNQHGVPADLIAAGYRWKSGTELAHARRTGDAAAAAQRSLQ